VAVTDVNATDALVRRAGGTVLIPPTVVPEEGSVGLYAGPDGAVFGAWQSHRHFGAEIVTSPGAMIWSELLTRDTSAANEFFAEVFGWTPKPATDVPGVNYTVWHAGGEAVAGMVEMDDEERWPPDVRPHWLTFFGAADLGASTAYAQQLGATVEVPPFELPIGYESVLRDPAGAQFALMQMREWPAS
jgi:predicted enzyme related to lactoylglutathione lyase